MALTTQQLEAKRDALISAIAAGVTEISVGDKTVRYQSISEMRSALAVVESEMSLVSTSTTKRVRQIRMYSTKGV